MRWKVDADYLPSLDAAAKAWAAQFTDEDVGAAFDSNPRRRIHRSVRARAGEARCTAILKNGGRCRARAMAALIDRCGRHGAYDAKNAANRDAYSLLQGQGRLLSLASAVPFRAGAHQGSPMGESDDTDALTMGLWIEDVTDPEPDPLPVPQYLSDAEYKETVRLLRKAIDEEDAEEIERLGAVIRAFRRED